MKPLRVEITPEQVTNNIQRRRLLDLAQEVSELLWDFYDREELAGSVLPAAEEELRERARGIPQ